MIFTERDMDLYSAPLSETEERRCKNAINMVKDALKDVGYQTKNMFPETLVEGSYAYTYELSHSSGRKVKLLLQGSYANNTNVRQNSDVDIAVILESTFSTKYRVGVSGASYGFIDSTDGAVEFKNDIERILRDYFVEGVERKNKSIKINGNHYRVDADTVPCMRYRDYSKDFSNSSENYVGGIVIIADDGEVIHNYPEQHIKNGRIKNVATGYLYKKMVRIMKKMRYNMEDAEISAAKKVSSFKLESLLWNIPDSWYEEYGIYKKVYVFDQLIEYLLKKRDEYPDYYEANAVKKLCPSTQECQDLYGFMKVLKEYYQYV